MGNTWITNLRHFLEEKGDLGDIPGPARKLAEYLCSIVKAATSYAFEISLPTGIRCRRRPKRKPCQGEIFAILDKKNNSIEWFCSRCDDNGIITAWENTKWDMRFSDMIIVRFDIVERDLIKNNTFSGPDLTDRLDAAKEVTNSITVYYSPEELEALLGYIAAEANHTTDIDLENELDALYESLEVLLDTIELKTLH